MNDATINTTSNPWRHTFLGAVVFIATSMPGTSYSSLITSQSVLGASPATVDFNQLEPYVGIPHQPDTLQVGGVAGNVTATGGGITYNGCYGLSFNGVWCGSNSNTYVLLGGEATGTVFEFVDGPVSKVGVFMDYTPDFSSPVYVTAYGENWDVLETYSIQANAPIYMPSGSNPGGFRGIGRAQNDIRGFGVSGSHMVFDNLQYSRVVVPLPGAVWLFGSGLLGLIGVARRKMRAA